MEIEVVAIGDPVKIEPVISNFLHCKQGNVFFISVPKTLQGYIISCLTSEKIKAMTYAQFKKFLSGPRSIRDLLSISAEEAFGWLRAGVDFFYVTYGNCFEMNSIEKKKIHNIHKIEPISQCFVSNNGAIYGFIKGQLASFFIGDELELIYEIKLDSTVDSIGYSEDDGLAALVTAETVSVYDIFRGLLICMFPAQPFYLSEDSIYFRTSDQRVLLTDGKLENAMEKMTSKEKTGSFSAFKMGREAKFLDAEPQQIMYSGVRPYGQPTVKRMAYVKNVDFYFGKSRLFAVITKNPGSGNVYLIESYLNEEITSLTLDSKVLDISVSDDFFVLQLSSYEVHFYAKDKYSFKRVETIKKEGPVKFSCFDTLCCLYSTSSGNIEFYDNAVLRTMYSHSGCTGIEWSPNGLYVATFSYSATSGCLVQIFNNNGMLMFKKVYNSLSKFGWRSTPEINKETRQRILKEHSLNEIEENDSDGMDKDAQLLLKEWKSYLASRIKKTEPSDHPME